MNNPFDPPSADLGAKPGRRNLPDLVVRIASVAMSVVTALGIMLVAPLFKPMFKGFGAELPLMTSLASDHTYVVWLLPILTSAVAFAWRNPRQRFHLSIVCGFVLSGLAWALFIYAMYLPIFRMAATE